MILGVMSLVLSLFFLTSFKVVFADTKAGVVTGLQIPRYVTTKKSKVFVRRGPGQKYKIDWIYQSSGYPFKVKAEFDHWRQIEDFQGEGGWVHFRLISGKRSVVIVKNGTLLRRKAAFKSGSVASINYGAVARLISANMDWCYVSIQGLEGWVLKTNVWGIMENEIINN